MWWVVVGVVVVGDGWGGGELGEGVVGVGLGAIVDVGWEEVVEGVVGAGLCEVGAGEVFLSALGVVGVGDLGEGVELQISVESVD